MEKAATPIRVTMVSPAGVERPDGGITQLLSYFMRGIAGDDRLDVDVFPTRTKAGAFSKHLSSLARLRSFAAHLRERGSDIVHLHVAPRGSTWRKMVFARVAQRAGRKVVLHLHGSGYDKFYGKQPGLLKKPIRHFFASADAVIALGAQWRSFMVETLGVDPDKVHAINNGVPTEEIDFVSCRPTMPPTILFAGAVGQRKGVDTLLKSLALLKADDWRCVICGDGDLEPYRRIARELGLQEARVEFLGWQSEAAVREQMCDAYMFVLPSRAENQPVAIIEAMAHGLPVISTNIGDIPNQVHDGETGFIVPPDEPGELAKRMDRLLESFDLGDKMGQAARRKYQDDFSIRQNIDRTVALYRGLMG